MSVCILTPGPLSTVQDLGRFGYAAQGYRTCGAADAYAARLANVLLGNAPGDAVLEMTLRGASLRFESDTVFALTGAESPATLDGAPVPFYAPLFAAAGSVLDIGMARTGLRSYLALGGGVTTVPVLGSRATDLKCRLGGFGGRALAAGDVLPVGDSAADAKRRWNGIARAHADRPLGDEAARHGAHPWRAAGSTLLPLLRAVAGPQQAAFTAHGLHTFTHTAYRLTADCDRMACKLKGEAIEMRSGADILSDGIAAGSVQISANGQPIVMLADHQTTGGYAKIATVISADLPALAQLRPGQSAAFDFVTPAAAVAAARAQAALLADVAQRLKP